MTTQIQLTIITPVFNGAADIGACIQNVIGQECLPCEHLIVDGGSTDGTLEIIKKFADKHSHIRYISESDKGQSDAMNKGIRFAQGKYISFLNGDDFYEPAVLNRVLSILRSLPEPAFVIGNCNVWGNDGSLKYINTPKNLKLDELLMGFDINQSPVNPSAYFYSKSLHEKIGYFDEKDHFAMDLDFIFRAADACHLRYVDEIWGNFRFREGTKTYDEVNSGRNDDRVKRMAEMYIQGLPLNRQIRIKAIKSILLRILKLKYYQSRLEYYKKKPELITGLIKRKLPRR